MLSLLPFVFKMNPDPKTQPIKTIGVPNEPGSRRPVGNIARDFDRGANDSLTVESTFRPVHFCPLHAGIGFARRNAASVETIR